MTKNRVATAVFILLCLEVLVVCAENNEYEVESCGREAQLGCVTVLDLQLTEGEILKVFRFQNCDWQKGSVPPGFLIAVGNLENDHQVLWGQFAECYKAEAYAIDLDHLAPCEIMTLFMDESNLWGCAHRMAIKEGKRLALQTVVIPVMGFSDLADESGALFTSDSGRVLTFSGTLGDTASVTLSYDSSGDSLSVNFTHR